MILSLWRIADVNFSGKIRACTRDMKRDTVTLWFACKHAETPLAAKILCMLAVVYAFSPIDLIPDFIPVLGYLDDVVLLPCLVWLAVKLIPPAILAGCRAEAAEWMGGEAVGPGGGWGILLVVLVWMAIAWLLWNGASARA
jgi:uncharacterized membrane protein YkvA (DUF1232 family)